MTKKWILINLLLVAVAAVAGHQLRVSIDQFKAEHDLAKIGPADALGKETILPPPTVIARTSPMDFAVIPEKNVFSETRSREESTAATEAAAAIPAAQKPSLVGVILAGKQRVATIREPAARGRNAQTLLLKVGDAYQDYTVAGIEADHVTLTRNGQSVVVHINDTTRPAQNRRMAAAASARVVPIGGSAAVPNTAAVIIAGQTPMTAGRTAGRATRQVAGQQTNVQQAAANTLGNLQNFILSLPNSTGQPGQAIVPILQGNPQQLQQAAPNTGTQGGTRVIRTPFGEIMRNQ